MAESQRATHRVLLPYEVVDGCLCAATTHAEVLEQKSWFEFDMSPSLSRRMWRLQNGRATGNLTVDAQVPRPPGSGGKGASA